jgi:response regulator RpfG family c-di-GMP phosphodiesterase
MQQYISEQIHPGVIRIQGMLRKIDCLRLPIASRRDVESILVRQVGKEIDRAFPWQTGHGCRTATISLLIGQAVGLTPAELHELKLAAFLHDIGLLMLPHDLIIGVNRLDSESYVTVQNHSRLGASLLEPFYFLREASVLMAHHHERWDGSGYPLRHQRTIHPPWSQDSLDCRCLRCNPHPRSLEPCRAKQHRSQNYPSRSRHPI